MYAVMIHNYALILQLEGGPLLDPPPSMRSNLARQAVAPENMKREDESADVDQPVMSWAKAGALKNMPFIIVTLEVSQSASG